MNFVFDVWQTKPPVEEFDSKGTHKRDTLYPLHTRSSLESDFGTWVSESHYPYPPKLTHSPSVVSDWSSHSKWRSKGTVASSSVYLLTEKSNLTHRRDLSYFVKEPFSHTHFLTFYRWVIIKRRKNDCLRNKTNSVVTLGKFCELKGRSKRPTHRYIISRLITSCPYLRETKRKWPLRHWYNTGVPLLVLLFPFL